MDNVINEFEHTCPKVRVMSPLSRSLRPGNRLPPPQSTTFPSSIARRSGSQALRDCVIKPLSVLGRFGFEAWAYINTNGVGQKVYHLQQFVGNDWKTALQQRSVLDQMSYCSRLGIRSDDEAWRQPILKAIKKYMSIMIEPKGLGTDCSFQPWSITLATLIIHSSTSRASYHSRHVVVTPGIRSARRWNWGGLPAATGLIPEISIWNS